MQLRFCGDLPIVALASGLNDAPLGIVLYGWHHRAPFDFEKQSLYRYIIKLPCSNDWSWILQQCKEARPKQKFKVWKSPQRLVVLTRFDDKHENAFTPDQSLSEFKCLRQHAAINEKDEEGTTAWQYAAISAWHATGCGSYMKWLDFAISNILEYNVL